ncbi:MAG: 1-phosphofructokinase [Oscillospiraceae bacterium]|nr:1-phosphofructokinase [Oscillospiraceae bacterium]
MVYTLTLNPALDHIIYLSEMKEGGLNRTSREFLEVGGKGINVSLELAELDIKSRALGFVAGFTGYEIERQLQERGIETDFVWLENGISRINVKLKNYGSEKITETSLNSDGPDIPDAALIQLFTKLGAISDGDTLVLSGSVPSSLPNDIYAQILEYLTGKSVKIVVDTQGEALASTLVYRPFLIKIDLDELGRMFGERPASMLEAAACASNLREMGAGNILISMAEDGALFLDENGGSHYCAACKGKVRNTMGTGDAMLAGFLSGALDDDTDMDYALLLGTAASGATAFSDGIAKKDEILDQMKILMKGNA